MQIPGVLNAVFNVKRYVSVRDTQSISPPDHLPPLLNDIFKEAATCVAVQCYNAAGAMFRLCIDLATVALLPEEGAGGGPNSKTRRDLGLRIPWLFDAGRLPPDLRSLSDCIREDGNDAAHRGTLSEADAEDLIDFTTALLERLYTTPERLRLADARRAQRRSPTPPEA